MADLLQFALGIDRATGDVGLDRPPADLAEYALLLCALQRLAAHLALQGPPQPKARVEVARGMPPGLNGRNNGRPPAR